MKPSNAIGRLIDACIDDERMLEHESRTVHGHRREVLTRLARQRARFVERLRELGPRTSGPWGRGSWVELAREIGRTLRVALTGSVSGSDAVSACRRSCRRTEARFDEALDLAWPEATREVLAEQRAGMHDAGDELLAIQY